MFEYIEIERCIFPLINTVRIWVCDRQVHYMIEGSPDINEQIEDAVAEISPEELFEKLEAIHISSWAKHYEPKDYVVLDGEGWAVKYKRAGEKVIRRSGENAWPAEWKKLLLLVKSIAGEIGEMY